MDTRLKTALAPLLQAHKNVDDRALCWSELQRIGISIGDIETLVIWGWVELSVPLEGAVWKWYPAGKRPSKLGKDFGWSAWHQLSNKEWHQQDIEDGLEQPIHYKGTDFYPRLRLTAIGVEKAEEQQAPGDQEIMAIQMHNDFDVPKSTITKATQKNPNDVNYLSHRKEGRHVYIIRDNAKKWAENYHALRGQGAVSRVMMTPKQMSQQFRIPIEKILEACKKNPKQDGYLPCVLDEDKHFQIAQRYAKAFAKDHNDWKLAERRLVSPDV